MLRGEISTNSTDLRRSFTNFRLDWGRRAGGLSGRSELFDRCLGEADHFKAVRERIGVVPLIDAGHRCISGSGVWDFSLSGFFLRRKNLQ